MKMFNHPMPMAIAVAAAAITFGAAGVQANTINVQLLGGGGGPSYTGTGAAPVTGTTWNHLAGNPSAAALVDSGGNATNVTFSAAGYNAGTVNSGNNALLQSYLFTSSSDAFSFGGLVANTPYDLYLYGAIGNAGAYGPTNTTGSQAATFTVNGLSQSTTGAASTAPSSSAISPSDAGKTYVEFTDITPTSGTISGTYAQPTGYHGGIFNGAQIVQVVPEPATLSVLGLGALALMRRRRKA